MDINEIRRTNISELIENKCAGNKSAFAKMIGKTDSQVYRIFNGGKNGRNVSTKTARHIEEKLSLESGSLDVSLMESSIIMDEDASNEAKEMLRIFSLLDSNGRKQMKDIGNTYLAAAKNR